MRNTSLLFNESLFLSHKSQRFYPIAHENAYLLCRGDSYAESMTMAMGAGPYDDELAVRPAAERQAASATI